MVKNCSNHIDTSIHDHIQHMVARKHNLPNYLEARIQVSSQLNIEEWELELSEYWDQQLLKLLHFRFPLDFNRNCALRSDNQNHASAVEYPENVMAYLEEEKQYKAIFGPFKRCPIAHAHSSSFMTHEKPNAPNRHVIIDLSWPKDASVINKTLYLGSEFSLTFPTIDDITQQLVKLGKGAHLYKIDISCAFRHLKIDPADYDLLTLQWNGMYVDTCLPFRSRHGSQNFQCVSESIHYMMRLRQFCIINYIDDFVGIGVPDVVARSFACLHALLECLGLTISKKKLIPPTTEAVCLGMLVNTVAGTISIPEEKLTQIVATVTEWKTKVKCTKRELQSLLGQLLYIHKYVHPARAFLNRMLELLHKNFDKRVITLTGVSMGPQMV